MEKTNCPHGHLLACSVAVALIICEISITSCNNGSRYFPLLPSIASIWSGMGNQWTLDCWPFFNSLPKISDLEQTNIIKIGKKPNVPLEF